MLGVVAVGLLWPNKKIKKKKTLIVPHSKFSTTLGYTRQDYWRSSRGGSGRLRYTYGMISILLIVRSSPTSLEENESAASLACFIF